MNYKLSLIVLCTLLCLLTINISFANEIEDSIILNSEIDDNNLTVSNEDDLLQDTNSFSNLNQRINQNQNKDVYLDSDYSFNSWSDSNLKNGIRITRDVTIHGNGHTINANNQARIFYISSNNLNVVFKDLVFINGKATDDGGAIWGKSTSINCTFLNNNAPYCGGAIYKGSAVNCNFITNVATDGGAIYAIGNNVNIENCSFEDNHAEEYGGAICFDAATYSTIKNCSFNMNGAETGGSLSILYTKYITISDSTFTSNTATLEGGAISYDFAVDNILDNCRFENNDALGQNGGAVSWVYTTGNITNNRFKRNSAQGDGGAIYVCLENKIYMTENQNLINCSFTENRARNGGAFYNNDYYRISGNTFSFIGNSGTV